MTSELNTRLDALFNPGSVAIIGAVPDPNRVGNAILDSIVTGGFPGRIFPVHPRYESILGCPVIKSLEQLPEVPDLAVVALNQRASIDTVAQLREMGVRGTVVLAGGYSEMGLQGKLLQDELRKAAGSMPVVGPNTLGFLNANANLNVTFYPRVLHPGNVSFLSQSGGIGLSLKTRADDEGLGIAKWVGVGNRVNLEFHDLLAYLGQDPETSVIGLFIEGSSTPRQFINTVESITPHKPVVIYKGGKGEKADRVTVTHTGAAAGPDKIWTGALKQAGAHIVDSVYEMITVCKALSIGRIPQGNGVAIFTHTAGPSIVACDILQNEPNFCLAELSAATIEKIAKILGPGVPVVHKNPVDGAAGAFLTEPFHSIGEAILEDPAVDCLITIFCEHKTWAYPSEQIAELSRRFNKTILVCYIGSALTIDKDRSFLHKNGVPTYLNAEDAAIGLSALLKRLDRHRSDF
jgi:acetyltransferase